MKNVTPYDEFEFVTENVSYEPLNEGVFAALKAVFGKLIGLFKDSAALNTSMDSAATRLGVKSQNVASKGITVGSTLLVKLQSPANEAVKTIFSFTKLGDLPDGSGLFQFTGTDNQNFLKTLTIKDNTVLNTVGVIAIVDPAGFVKDKPVTMRMYKNVTKDGAPIVTESTVVSAMNAEEVAKEKPAAKPATAPAAPAGTTPTV